jgi:hypothetical protein
LAFEKPLPRLLQRGLAVYVEKLSEVLGVVLGCLWGFAGESPVEFELVDE